MVRRSPETPEATPRAAEDAGKGRGRQAQRKARTGDSISDAFKRYSGAVGAPADEDVTNDEDLDQPSGVTDVEVSVDGAGDGVDNQAGTPSDATEAAEPAKVTKATTFLGRYASSSEDEEQDQFGDFESADEFGDYEN